MSRPKLPDFTTVIALAEQTDCRVSLIDLARMHKHSEYSEQAVDALWPDATPRVKAAYMGLKRYRAQSCVRCGCTQRYTGGTNCVGCVTENRDRHYAENPEKRNASGLKWQRANSEYHALRIRAWRSANPEKVKAINAKTRARRAVAKEQQPC